MSDLILMTQLARQHREMMGVQLGNRRDYQFLSERHGAAVANYNNLLRDYRNLERLAKQRIAELERQLAEADLARQRAEAEAAYERTNAAMKRDFAEQAKKEPFAD
jgi:hypothetical protein